MEMMVMGDITLIKDVVCPFCGSNCDDIEVEVQDNKILNVYNACSVGASVFMPIKGVKGLQNHSGGKIKPMNLKK